MEKGKVGSEGTGRSFVPLFTTNFFGVVNDNFLKTLAGFVAVGWLSDARWRGVFMGVTAGMLVLPYIFCSPLADRLTVAFKKRKILTLAKWAELPIVAVAIAGFACRSLAMVVAGILLMGLQSSLYSPAKYALVRDVGGEGRISTGMGGMEGVTFLGVLAGTIAASFAADLGGVRLWAGALAFFALAGLVASWTIRADEERSRAIHSVNPWRYLRRSARMAGRYPGLNAVIVTISVFWWAAAMLQMGLFAYGREVLGLDATRTGALLCAAAVGIVAGQVTAGLIDRRRCLLAATPLTGGAAAAILYALYFVPMGPLAFGVALSLLAFAVGLFKLPFDAEIQKVVKGPKLNTMLSYFNQVSFLFMLGASGCYALVSAAFGPRAFLLVLAVVMTVTPVAFVFSHRKALMSFGRWVLSRRYAVKADGLEALATGKTYLVLPNHPAMVDPMLVAVTLKDTAVRPLADEKFFHTGLLAPRALKTLGAVAVPDLRAHRSRTGATVARGLFDVVKTTLAGGGNVIFYPSGHLYTEDREQIGTRQLAHVVCGELPAGVEVIGVRTKGLWGSIWSRKGRTSSPAFLPTLAKSVFLWLFVAPFRAKRPVTMHFENLTDRVREWSALPRLEFNRRLEQWYNEG